MGQHRYRSLVLHTTEQNIFKIIICHKFLESLLKSQCFPFCVSPRNLEFLLMCLCAFLLEFYLLFYFCDSYVRIMKFSALLNTKCLIQNVSKLSPVWGAIWIPVLIRMYTVRRCYWSPPSHFYFSFWQLLPKHCLVCWNGNVRQMQWKLSLYLITTR